MSIFFSIDELQGELSLQFSAAGSTHCSSWKKGLNEHKYNYKSGSCILSAMLSLIKKTQNSSTRVPDCILILIHWLLSTSVHWEPKCNKHLKKSPWRALWSGRKLKPEFLPGTVWIPHAKPLWRSSVIWLQQENDRARFWVIQEHNITALTHGELHPLQTCFHTASPAPSHPVSRGRLLQVPIFLSFIMEWPFPETP